MEPKCWYLDTGTGSHTLYTQEIWVPSLLPQPQRLLQVPAPQAPSFKYPQTHLCHFIRDEMDPNQQKKKGGKHKYEFPIHGKWSHAVDMLAVYIMMKTIK
jgi:hypothetical protein